MMRSFGFWVLVSVMVNLAAGLVAFSAATDRMTALAIPVPTDAIVVLTGGSGERIKQAGILLQQQKGTRLLISGVNPKVTQADLRKLTGLSKAELDCCVDVDEQAKNTNGNARQVSLWAQEKGYDSLLVVTSSYHMPRALLLFRQEMPGIDLTPAPTRSTGSAQQHAARRTLFEYGKFLVALAFIPQQPSMEGTS